MTIYSVTRMWSRSSGSAEDDKGKSIKTAWAEGWQVSHSANATEPEIISASGLPKMRDLYPGTFACCKKIGQSTRLGPCLSIVPIDYVGESGPDSVTDSPLNKRPSIEWRSRTSQEAVDRDWWGRPIATVNGEPVEGITMDLVDQTLVIERNFELFSPHLVHPYLHSVSSDRFPTTDSYPFGMYDAGLAKLMDYSAKEESAAGFEFWKVNATIFFRYPYQTTAQRAWFSRNRHEGFYERIGSLLTFSGGGPTGPASGHAVVNSGGAITAVVVTSGGAGYTSAPSVAAADGSGATFTAIITDGRVSSVTVTAGGTGYKTRVVRAVDDEQVPTQKPVLLKLDGSRELNANNAAWIETQLYGALPYSALGLM